MSKIQQTIDSLFDQQKAAEDFGFVWDNISQLVNQAGSECDEIQDVFKDGKQNPNC